MEGEVIGKYKVGEWFFVAVELFFVAVFGFFAFEVFVVNVFGFDETDGQVGES